MLNAIYRLIWNINISASGNKHKTNSRKMRQILRCENDDFITVKDDLLDEIL